MGDLTRQGLAAGLGISRQMVHKLAQQGMPTDSVAAARAWRKRTLRPFSMKGERITDFVPPTGEAELAAVERLWPVAIAALEADRFDLVEAEMRAALRAVPIHLRDQVVIDFGVYERLTTYAMAYIVDPEDAARGASAPPDSPKMSDAELELMGRFWYSVAAREPIDWTEFGC